MKVKSIILLLIYSSFSFASAVIALSGGGAVASNTNTNIALLGLSPLVTYSTICYIDTTYPFQYLLLGSTLNNPNSLINSYNINGYLTTQNQLMAGHNVVVIEGKFADPTTETLVINNLDQNNAFNVNQCFAIPAQAPTGASVQRIDVANLLWNDAAGGNGGLTNTVVSVTFYTGSAEACETKIVPFQGELTVLAGTGQPCSTPIHSMGITPLANTAGVVYEAPLEMSIDTSNYLSQVVIAQNSPPVFNPANATLENQGTVLTTINTY